MHRHHNYGLYGLKMYSKRIHLVITFFALVLPVLFILFITPGSSVSRLDFLQALSVSAIRLLIAYCISVLLAVILGITLSRGKVGAFFLPVFDVLQSFPTFALLPLAVHFLGADDLTVIFFLVITLIWPILFAIISALKLVRGDWEEAANIFGATGLKKLFYFILPISYPGIITGSIVGLGEGWEAVVGAEIIVGLQTRGLGAFFTQNGASGRLVFFGVTALLLCIFTLNKIIWLPLLEKSHKLLSE